MFRYLKALKLTDFDITTQVEDSQVYKDFIQDNPLFYIGPQNDYGLSEYGFNINYNGLANDTPDGLCHEIAHVLVTDFESHILPDSGIETGNEGDDYTLGLIDEFYVVTYENVLCRHYGYSVMEFDPTAFAFSQFDTVELLKFLQVDVQKYDDLYVLNGQDVQFSEIIDEVKRQSRVFQRSLSFNRMLAVWESKSDLWWDKWQNS